jgi:hypothetical protein
MRERIHPESYNKDERVAPFIALEAAQAENCYVEVWRRFPVASIHSHGWATQAGSAIVVPLCVCASDAPRPALATAGAPYPQSMRVSTITGICRVVFF